ncbi:MAG: sigma-70 family RNA polymerase sigma factor [Sphaerobacter sp.]|nr:sigma-70 family RNA polymerase sigma factor [Sphaerobacter sp.]
MAQPLFAESLGDFNPTPGLDALISTLARRAKTDPAARNALYRALGYKIYRFVRRYRYRTDRLVICDLEDVAQEAFVVLCDLVAAWPGQESFLGYFFSRFPWRLARAIDVAERGWSAARLTPLDDLETARTLAPVDPDDLFALAEIGAGLDPRDRVVLELHIGYRLHLREVAHLLGVHPQTVYRAWARISAEVRRTWPEIAPRRRRRRDGQPPGDARR